MTTKSSLVDLPIAFGVIVVGALALLWLLTGAAVRARAGARRAEARIRAEALLESVRAAPSGAMLCLVEKAAAEWGSCEASCRAAAASSGNADSWPCRYRLPDDSVARGYYVAPATRVALTGEHRRVDDLTVAVGWHNRASSAATEVTLRSAVFVGATQ